MAVVVPVVRFGLAEEAKVAVAKGLLRASTAPPCRRPVAAIRNKGLAAWLRPRERPPDTMAAPPVRLVAEAKARLLRRDTPAQIGRPSAAIVTLVPTPEAGPARQHAPSLPDAVALRLSQLQRERRFQALAYIGPPGRLAARPSCAVIARPSPELRFSANVVFWPASPAAPSFDFLVYTLVLTSKSLSLDQKKK